MNIYHFYCFFKDHISVNSDACFVGIFYLKTKEYGPNRLKFHTFQPKIKKKKNFELKTKKCNLQKESMYDPISPKLTEIDQIRLNGLKMTKLTDIDRS